MHTRYGFDDGGPNARRVLVRWAFIWVAAIVGLVIASGCG
jgi:hypothetical protein